MSAAARTVGHRAKRIEDPALLAGRGRYLDDIALPGMVHAAFVRSAHAHALLRAIDTREAAALAGVVRIFTARSIAPALTRLRMPLGFATNALPQDITPNVLADGEVCYVGDPLVLVLAASRQIAEDAAALVAVDYEPLPVVSDPRQALDPAAPKVRRNAAANVLTSYHVAYGDPGAAFARAAQVSKVSLVQHRGGAHSIEGRGVLARYDPGEDSLTLWSSTQMPHDVKFAVADMLGLAEPRVRVVTPDVGGGFGAKFMVYAEEVAIAAAAKLAGCPVKWVEDRLEHFIGTIQERDQYWDMEIAVDADARILGVRGRLVHDQGAYTPQGVNCAYNAATGVTGPYIVPAYDLEVFVAQTNKVPVIPVRGAGYPEAAFTMERLLDAVARDSGRDPAEVRRRNLVPADKMPYVKPLKNRAGEPIILDSGDYLGAQARVLEAIGYAGFAERQRRARAQGRHLGIGFANSVKGTGRGPFESGGVSISPSGRITVSTGAVAMGQGIKTTLAQICAEQLRVPVDRIDVVAGDTAGTAFGLGGFASRQTITAGSSVHLAAIEVRTKAIKLASRLLEAAEADLELADGKVIVAGVPGHGVALGEIARLLKGVAGYALPEGMTPGLEATLHWPATQMTYANATHACEVEVDIETGGVRVLRYIALQDAGRLVNPALVEGQLHGGIVHGIGNALFEYMRYDDQAQPTTTTFADYLLVTATELPPIEILFMESPTPTNPLGVKGVGEGGTIPVAACIAQAVENALAPFGVLIDTVPIQPVALLERIEAARARG